jgi:hypothetical protein
MGQAGTIETALGYNSGGDPLCLIAEPRSSVGPGDEFCYRTGKFDIPWVFITVEYVSGYLSKVIIACHFRGAGCPWAVSPLDTRGTKSRRKL